jgi:Transglutaminase-like superfamily/Amino-terminal Zinc-binding domain of ubiquitin ligase E3A
MTVTDIAVNEQQWTISNPTPQPQPGPSPESDPDAKSSLDSPAQQSRIIQCGDKTISSQTAIRSLYLQPGMSILVTRVEQIKPPPDTSQSDAAAHSMFPMPATQQDLSTTCSRVFLGQHACRQPGVVVQDDCIACLACTNLCLQQVFRELGQPAKLETTQSFTCCCHELSLSRGGIGCLFHARYSAHSSENTVVSSAFERIANGVQQQQSSREKQIMLRRIQSQLQLVQQYEDLALQEQARQVIPQDDLSARAAAAVESQQKEAEESDTPIKVRSLRDQLAFEVVLWFQRFFSWVNQPPCDTCKKATKAVGGAAPIAEEKRYLASTVEVYQCADGHITRFPRYNHAGKLLETKRGRCGEWANCATLCLRSLGFDVRLIIDWTDHVWTEVFSEHENRWIHCEAPAFDTPLKYENGWKKKLTYVLGFNFKEVVDVTRRYTRQWQQVLERRTLVPEGWLSDTLANCRTTLAQRLSSEAVATLQAHQVAEAKELAALTDPQTTESTTSAIQPEELKGRDTGSMEWRLSRGEVHLTESQSNARIVFKSYLKQLTSGCNNTPCASKYCASCSSYQQNLCELFGKLSETDFPLSDKRAAAIAMHLCKKFGPLHVCASHHTAVASPVDT